MFAPWRRYVLALFRRDMPLIPTPPAPTSGIMKAILAVIALAIFTARTADASQRATAPSKEVLLVQSGFKLVTVTTPKQKEAVNGLAQGRCSAVQYNGKLFYVFPAATKDAFYVGKQ